MDDDFVSPSFPRVLFEIDGDDDDDDDDDVVVVVDKSLSFLLLLLLSDSLSVPGISPC